MLIKTTVLAALALVAALPVEGQRGQQAKQGMASQLPMAEDIAKLLAMMSGADTQMMGGQMSDMAKLLAMMSGADKQMGDGKMSDMVKLLAMVSGADKQMGDGKTSDMVKLLAMMSGADKQMKGGQMSDMESLLAMLWQDKKSGDQRSAGPGRQMIGQEMPEIPSPVQINIDYSFGGNDNGGMRGGRMDRDEPSLEDLLHLMAHAAEMKGEEKKGGCSKDKNLKMVGWLKGGLLGCKDEEEGGEDMIEATMRMMLDGNSTYDMLNKSMDTELAHLMVNLHQMHMKMSMLVNFMKGAFEAMELGLGRKIDWNEKELDDLNMKDELEEELSSEDRNNTWDQVVLRLRFMEMKFTKMVAFLVKHKATIQVVMSAVRNGTDGGIEQEVMDKYNDWEFGKLLNELMDGKMEDHKQNMSMNATKARIAMRMKALDTKITKLMMYLHKQQVEFEIARKVRCSLVWMKLQKEGAMEWGMDKDMGWGMDKDMGWGMDQDMGWGMDGGLEMKLKEKKMEERLGKIEDKLSEMMEFLLKHKAESSMSGMKRRR